MLGRLAVELWVKTRSRLTFFTFVPKHPKHRPSEKKRVSPMAQRQATDLGFMLELDQANARRPGPKRFTTGNVRDDRKGDCQNTDYGPESEEPSRE